ncbi:AAA family ATPase [Candidatus Micrarchaeota archaeon]|nr:AAA family ATPase [Candidatus Micrarchaeota archaeon]
MGEEGDIDAVDYSAASFANIPEPAKEEKVKTDIPGLDSMIDGGFERKSVIIVSGAAGSGKTILSLQFLYNGATKYNEPGLYITFEEQKESVFKHMLNFGWNFAELEKERKIVFLEYPPHEVDRFISEGAVIEDMVRDYGIQRVVMDSITSFMLLYNDEYRRRQVFLKTMEILRKWGCTTLLTSEGMGTEDGEVKTRFGVEFLADGLLSIHTIKKSGVKEFALEVVKLRGAAHEMRMNLMKITPQGIEIYPSQPVFGGD